MQWWEVNRCLAGIRRRQRTQWEATRWEIQCIANLFRGRDTPAVRAHELQIFPWEKEFNPASVQPPVTEQDAADLQAEMAIINGAQEAQE